MRLQWVYWVALLARAIRTNLFDAPGFRCRSRAAELHNFVPALRALTLHIPCLAAVFWRNKLLPDQTRNRAERFVTLRLSLVEAYFNIRQPFSICARGADEFYASPALDVAVLGCAENLVHF